MLPDNLDERELWPVEAVIGEIVYPPGGDYGPRLQTTVQLVILYSGEMTVWIDNVKFYSPAGTVCLLLPGHHERFAFARDRKTHHSWLHASLPYLPDQFVSRLAQLPWSLPLSAMMELLVSQGLQISKSFNPTAPAMLRALAAQMLWLYIGEGETQTNKSLQMGQPIVIIKALQFIQSSLGDGLNLMLIAERIGISSAQLTRLFHKHLDTTVMEYVWKQRVKFGIDLLSNTGLSVAEITERCGFRNSFHFSRRVRQATGYSPRSVRSNNWGNIGRPD